MPPAGVLVKGPKPPPGSGGRAPAGSGLDRAERVLVVSAAVVVVDSAGVVVVLAAWNSAGSAAVVIGAAVVAGVVGLLVVVGGDRPVSLAGAATDAKPVPPVGPLSGAAPATPGPVRSRAGTKSGPAALAVSEGAGLGALTTETDLV